MFDKIEITIAKKSVSILIENESQKDGGFIERPPCFVVGLSSHYHDKFSEEFRSFYKLVLIDLYWTDDKFFSGDIEKLTMDMLVKHIEEVRAQLEKKFGEAYKKVFIAAHSAYGFISMNYAIKYPDNLLGVINIASPLTFNAESLLKWQEEYMYSNFGNCKVYGPTKRFSSYYEQKSMFAKQKNIQGKDFFVKWYVSMGALLWKKPILWQNIDDKASKIWEPWKIQLSHKQFQTSEVVEKDVNTSMIFHYVDLISKINCYDALSKIKVPVLWVISLYDSRVSLYQLEDEKLKSISTNVEFFHPAQASHWPMYSKDCNTTEFDNKAVSWGQEIVWTYQSEQQYYSTL